MHRPTWQRAATLLAIALLVSAAPAAPPKPPRPPRTPRTVGDAPQARPLPKVRKIGQSVIDEGGLVLASGRWGRTFNGTSFQQDALVTHAGWQYATWYDSERRLCVGRRKLPDGAWQLVRFGDYRVGGNDSHNVPTLGLCGGDGTIHLAFDHHGHPLHYRVTRAGPATRPDDVEWSADLFGPVTDRLEAGKPVRSVTYPRFLKAPGGRLQLIYRAGGSGNGDWHLADYDPASSRWTADGVFISRHGKYQDSASRCAYLNDPRYDARGRLVLTFCWRETADPVSNHDIGFTFSKDRGQTWLGNAEEPIGRRGDKPLGVQTPGLCAQQIPTAHGLLNSNTQAVDSAGRVHVVISHMPPDEPNDANWRSSRRKARYYHYWRDGNGRWTRTPMDFVGTRPKLWLDRHDNAFLVFARGGQLNIAAASAEQQWARWGIVHTEPGRVIGEPLIDAYRGRGVISVYAQQPTENKAEGGAPLRVLDFEPAP